MDRTVDNRFTSQSNSHPMESNPFETHLSSILKGTSQQEGDRNSSIPCLVDIPVSIALLGENVIGLTVILPTLATFLYQQLYYNATYKCILVMLFADAMAAIFAGPIASFVAVRGCDALPQLWCSVHAFVMFFSGLLKINIITTLALLRFYIMSRTLNSDHTKRLSQRFATAGIILSLFFALMWALCPFFGLNEYVKDGVGCSIRWHNGPLRDLVYVGLLFLLEFIIPFMFILVAYGLILKTICRSRYSIVQNENLRIQREYRVIGLTVVIAVAYLISWTPYAICAFFMFLDHPPNHLLMVLSIVLAKASYIWDSIIYTWALPELRNFWFSFIRRCASRWKTNTTSEIDEITMNSLPLYPNNSSRH